MRGLIVMMVVAMASYGQGMFGVEPNAGQLAEDVLFLQRGGGMQLNYTRDAVRYAAGFEVQLLGVDAQVKPTLEDLLPTIYNFYPGGANQRMYRTVRLGEVYRGIQAAWSSGSQLLGGVARFGQLLLKLSIAPGSDLHQVRLRVNIPGAFAIEANGGIQFVGGKAPGVFPLVASTAQGNVGVKMRLENGDTVRFESEGLDLANGGEVVVAFPNYADGPNGLPNPASDGNRYSTGVARIVLANSIENQAVISRMGEDRVPVWVTVFGGVGEDSVSLAEATVDGVVVVGVTGARDFPVTANAPVRTPGAERTPYLALFDRASGAMRNATLVETKTNAGLGTVLVEPNGDVIAGGGAQMDLPDGTYRLTGMLVRWRPTTNQILHSNSFDDPFRGLARDAQGNVVYATFSYRIAPARLRLGALSSVGAPVGRVVELTFGAGVSLGEIRLLPGAGQALTAVYFLSEERAKRTSLGSYSLVDGTIRFVRSYVGAYGTRDVAVGTNGEIRLALLSDDAPILPVTPDAAMVAPCENTSYYTRVSATGAVLYASYVNVMGLELDKAEANRGVATLACVASTAGRRPIGAVAPGQMVTLTGGNFGPTTAAYAAPDGTGKFPMRFGGYQVKVGGMDAPIVAVARGVVAVQVPYEVAGTMEFAISGPDAPMGTVQVATGQRVLRLFDTGDANNVSGKTALAALNQDGTVNSATNPAALGSIVSVFGTGLNRIDGSEETGGLYPTDRILSSQLVSVGYNGTPVYVGSAPGLMNAVFQANLRLTEQFAGTGVRPMPLGMAVGESLRNLFIFEPQTMIWVR